MDRYSQLRRMNKFQIFLNQSINGRLAVVLIGVAGLVAPAYLLIWSKYDFKTYHLLIAVFYLAAVGSLMFLATGRTGPNITSAETDKKIASRWKHIQISDKSDIPNVSQDIAKRHTLIWVLVSLPSVFMVAVFGKLKPSMPFWQLVIAIYAVFQLALAMTSVRRIWRQTQNDTTSQTENSPEYKPPYYSGDQKYTLENGVPKAIIRWRMIFAGLLAVLVTSFSLLSQSIFALFFSFSAWMYAVNTRNLDRKKDIAIFSIFILLASLFAYLGFNDY